MTEGEPDRISDPKSGSSAPLKGDRPWPRARQLARSAMSALSQVFAAITAALHVWIFLMESVLWRRPEVYRRFRVAPE